MARKSTIGTLPKPILDQVNKLLREQVNLDDIVERLKDLGYERSRSAIDRHNQKVKRIGQRLRQSREMANALAENLGDAAVHGKQGRLLVETARTLAFDLMTAIAEMQERADQQAKEGGEPSVPLISPRDIAFLGKGIAELGRALRFDQDFEGKLRETVRAEERERAAADVEAVAAKGGVSERALTEIRELLGIKPGDG
jgi:hypothetical protein